MEPMFVDNKINMSALEQVASSMNVRRKNALMSLPEDGDYDDFQAADTRAFESLVRDGYVIEDLSIRNRDINRYKLTGVGICLQKILYSKQ